METLRGFDNITLFQKLKDCLADCLAGPALTIASKYSARSQNSYEAAMKDLLDKFEDQIELAGSNISSAVAALHSSAEHAKAILHSLNALHKMKDVFE
jgi:hypothetical protein